MGLEEITTVLEVQIHYRGQHPTTQIIEAAIFEGEGLKNVFKIKY